MRISDWSSDVCSSDLASRTKSSTVFRWKSISRSTARLREAEVAGRRALSVIAAVHSFAHLKRSAFPITETELSPIAAAAMIGLNSQPNAGYRMPEIGRAHV